MKRGMSILESSWRYSQIHRGDWSTGYHKLIHLRIALIYVTVRIDVIGGTMIPYRKHVG